MAVAAAASGARRAVAAVCARNGAAASRTWSAAPSAAIVFVAPPLSRTVSAMLRATRNVPAATSTSSGAISISL